MSFITADQVRKVRLLGAKPFVIEGLDLKLQIIKLSSAATLEGSDLQALVTAGKKTHRDIVTFMLANGVVDEKGDLIGEPAAKELLAVVPVETLNQFMGEVNASAAKADPGKA